MGSKNLRQPAVAGRFYPGSEEALKREVLDFMAADSQGEYAIGAVMPHAGYVYSGSIAGQTAAAISIPDRVVLLGPNHTGMGPTVSVFPGGGWVMPFGDVPVDGALAADIIHGCELAEPDQLAHLREHSLEVQLPFLYYATDGGLSFVPVTMSMMNLENCRSLGQALARVISNREEEILLVSSSDMTHYESHDSAKAKDTAAIERILDMDPEGLLEVVTQRRISMCGIIPTVVMIFAALDLGAKSARLVRYATSGEVSGDYHQVVGYAGIVVQ